jgi:hypothetical protein
MVGNCESKSLGNTFGRDRGSHLPETGCIAAARDGIGKPFTLPAGQPYLAPAAFGSRDCV